MKFQGHITVLKKETIQAMIENQVSSRDLYFVDMTFGGGGHCFALSDLDEKLKVVGLDQDPDALSSGRERIISEEKKDKIFLEKSNFVDIENALTREPVQAFIGDKQLGGCYADLGVSSHQFDVGERGFSFRFDGPLDMRMNPDDDEFESAADVIQDYDEESLAEIFRTYGEERFAKRIAQQIAEHREKEPIKTTKQLEDIIFHCYPKKMRHQKIHPATRVFQALRIFVNKELDYLTEMIHKCVKILPSGARIAIISFHSLEDRIVKHTFRNYSKDKVLKLITKKPINPTEEEIFNNSRSRSAKLRIAEKV
jgi:16S rRNA (cytosine1402-N4)-methyltransferase